MISICIPIYNFNVATLVTELSSQAKLLTVPSEIILIDDFSNESFRKINETACLKETYVKLDQNIGRAAIRNLFLKHTTFPSLIFLDCDSIITNKDFLSSYLNTAIKFPNHLICGGREYPHQAPHKNKLLRWKYGFYKESQSVEKRKQHPNRSFMTNNFLVSRKIFERTQFDTTLVEYGHEDTLFGLELKRKDINIIHIDNPVLNGDLENNAQYIENTEKAIRNLIHILKSENYDKQLIEDVNLLKTYYKLFKLRKLITTSFNVLKPLIKVMLEKGIINLYVFNFYKLGFLATNMKRVE